MPPRRSATLTEAELRLMDVLWQRGPCTVQQVLEALTDKPSLAYNSVLTTIRVLERKGYLEHSKDGRAHIYVPLVERQEATRTEIGHLVSRFFKNSKDLLVLNILEDAVLRRTKFAVCANCWPRAEDGGNDIAGIGLSCTPVGHRTHRLAGGRLCHRVPCLGVSEVAGRA